MKPKKNLWRVAAATAAAVATLLGGGVAVSSAVAAETYDISQVGTVKPTAYTPKDDTQTHWKADVDGKPLYSDAIVPSGKNQNGMIELTGSIDKTDAMVPGSKIVIPITWDKANHWANLDFKCDPDVMVDGRDIFTLQCSSESLILTATQADADYSSADFKIHLSYFTSHQNLRANMLATTSSVKFGQSTMVLYSQPSTEARIDYTNHGFDHHGSPASSDFRIETSVSKWTNQAVDGTLNTSDANLSKDNILVYEVRPKTGVISRSDLFSFIQLCAGFADTDTGKYASGYLTNVSMYSADGLKANQVTGLSRTQIADPVEAGKHLKAGQFAMVEDADHGGVVAINLGSYLDPAFPYKSEDLANVGDEPTRNLATMLQQKNYYPDIPSVYGYVYFESKDIKQMATVTSKGVLPMIFSDSDVHTLQFDVSNEPQSNSGDAQDESYLAYNANDVTYPNAPKATGSTASQTGSINDQVTVQSNGFSRENWTFTGWNTQPDGNGTSYTAGKSKYALIQGGSVLYAQWKQIPATVHYDPNGGTGTTPDTNGGKGDHTTLTPNGFTKECWLFDSWNTKKDGTGTKYTDKQAVTLDGDLTLYAQWKHDPACAATLTYDKNSGTATGTTKGYEGWKGDTATVAKTGFENEGYTFDSWNTQADGKGTAHKQGDKIVLPAGTTTLYAQWKEIPGTLSWAKTDKETGKVLAGSEWDLADKQGQTVHVTDNGELDQAEDEGAFKLTGLKWGEYTLTETKAPAGHDKLTKPISLTIDAQHITVSLGDVTNSRTPATVHYDPNGGQGHMDDRKGFVGDTPEAGDNKFTNKDECKEFAGWNTQADGKGKTYQSKDQVDPLTGDITLYAQWKTKDNCPAAKPGELGHTGSSVLPYAFSAVLLLLSGAALLVLRRQRHGQHA